MTAKFFVDTNVLLYPGSHAADDGLKRQAAPVLLSRPDIALSAQVLQEFYAVAVSKRRLQITHDEALAVLQSLAAFPVCPITRELVMDAVELRQPAAYPRLSEHLRRRQGPSIWLGRWGRDGRDVGRHVLNER